MTAGRPVLLAAFLVVAFGTGVSAQLGRSPVGWPTHGGNAAHTALSATKVQPLNRVVWSTPLDLVPQYNGDVLYAHYGSPVVTPGNVVVLPVKTGANGGFQIEARNGATGGLVWQQDTDYVVPSHNWFPTLGPTIVRDTVGYPRKAGMVSFRGLGARDKAKSVCFYGMASYKANPAAYDAAVRISSPLVTTDNGAVVFTYRVEGATPLGLKGGLAMINSQGVGSYIEGAVATGDASFVRPKLNGAPAVANGIAYAVFKNGGSDGMLVGIDLGTLKPKYKAVLSDPKNGGPSYVDEEGTACPTVGPDGDVYFGVLENPFGTHHYRGWLLHFNKTLTTPKTPSSFGWDDTPSIVPKALVPSYHGDSQYLVMTKYNNYAGPGDGVNLIALLDPNATQTDPYSGVTTMKEVLTKVGPTADAEHTGSYPNAVREWCINTAAVDVTNRVILVNCEDGVLYRWNLSTNELDQKVALTNGIGQAYTPTAIGPTGMTFAVSNARLYAVGK